MTMAWRVFAIVAMLFFTAPAAVGFAQIKTDESFGRRPERLTGENVDIRQELGQVLRGSQDGKPQANLFHSFETFNISNGQTVTFKGDADIQHVISRVTGKDTTSIKGKLTSEVGANRSAGFWFINPNGVTFGSGTEIDVPGAFHVSTADGVRLGDGVEFSAHDRSASSLTSAPPEAFGFVRPNPMQLTLHRANIGCNNGATCRPPSEVSLVGGGILVRDTLIQPADRGRIRIVGGGAGRIYPSDLQKSSIDSFSDVVLTSTGSINEEGSTQFNIVGDGAGRIDILGKRVDIKNAQIFANNTGDSDASRGGGRPTLNDNGVFVSASESFSIKNSRLNSRTSTGSQGRAGVISIDAAEIEIRDSDISVDGFSEEGAGGPAGRILLNANGLIRIEDRARIGERTSISALGAGASAGDVTIESDSAHVLVSNSVLISTALFNSVDESHSAGNVEISGKSIVFFGRRNEEDERAIFAFMENGRGSGGKVNFDASLEIVLSGTVINSEADSDGTAGDIMLSAGKSVRLTDKAIVSSSADDNALAGNIVVTRADVVEINDSAIRTNAGSKQGGNITIRDVGGLVLFEGGRITTDAESGPGGEVRISPDVLAARGGTINARSDEDEGGFIKVFEGLKLDDVERPLETHVDGATNGTIEIDATEEDLTGDLTELPEAFLIEERLFEQSCAARSGRPVSSLSESRRPRPRANGMSGFWAFAGGCR